VVVEVARVVVVVEGVALELEMVVEVVMPAVGDVTA